MLNRYREGLQGPYNVRLSFLDVVNPSFAPASFIRTTRFFGRTDIIQRMEEHFKAIKPESSFQSLALHGLGGVGKSTVALKYAEQKLQRGELDALFWVHSEKLVSIRKSFTNMAIRLKLPDAREGDHEENQAAMLNWLQRTRLSPCCFPYLELRH